MDWSDKGIDGTKVCLVVDDASRKLLGGGEFTEATEENSMHVFQDVVNDYWWIRPMRELIIDNGSHFGAQRTDERGAWNSPFKKLVNSMGTKIIRTRVNHPQTNGKVEKVIDVYVRYRKDFSSFREFMRWYNDVRPHESLKKEYLETPGQAFWRKLPPENLLGVACRLFRW
jgi:putative transposase